jgi:hypothetical protein
MVCDSNGDDNGNGGNDNGNGGDATEQADHENKEALCRVTHLS